MASAGAAVGRLNFSAILALACARAASLIAEYVLFSAAIFSHERYAAPVFAVGVVVCLLGLVRRQPRTVAWGAVLGGLLLGTPHIDYRAIFMLSALLRTLPLVLLFVVFRPERLPLWLRWLYARVRSLEALAGPAQADVLRISVVPRALGSRSTDPPPAL